MSKGQLSRLCKSDLDTWQSILEGAWQTLLKFVLSEYSFLFLTYITAIWMISVMGISTMHSLLPGRINWPTQWLTITITQMWSCCMDHGVVLYLLYKFSLPGLKTRRLANMQLCLSLSDCCVGLRIFSWVFVFNKTPNITNENWNTFAKIYFQSERHFSLNVEVIWVTTV